MLTSPLFLGVSRRLPQIEQASGKRLGTECFPANPAGRDKAAWDDAVVWLHDVAAECTEPSRRLELAEFRGNLETALGKLPPRVAQVFQLYVVEECPNREVCRRLNISESNLWVTLHRARKQLRGHLTDWWNADSQQNQRSNTLSL